jgi:hypothetical protein
MPKSIKLFEQLFLIAIGLGFVQAGILNTSLRLSGNALLFTIIVQGLTALVLAGLVLLISRKQNKICKWILIVFFIAGLFTSMPTLTVLFQNKLLGAIAVFQISLQGFGIYLLFNPDSQRWFNKNNQNMIQEEVHPVIQTSIEPKKTEDAINLSTAANLYDQRTTFIDENKISNHAVSRPKSTVEDSYVALLNVRDLESLGLSATEKADDTSNTDSTINSNQPKKIDREQILIQVRNLRNNGALSFSEVQSILSIKP